MGLNFRKSVKVAPGVKVNFGKKSVGVSVGNKYVRKSVSTSGRKTTTIGTPINGLNYTETTYGGGKKASEKASAPSMESNYSNPKTPSKTTYKVCGIILTILAVILVLMSLLLCIGELVGIGLGGIVFGIILFVIGKGYLKIAKSTSDDF